MVSRRLLQAVLCAALVLTANAQSSSSAASDSTGDADWTSVSNKGGAHNDKLPATADKATVDAARAKAIANYVADADALQAFYTKHPGHAKAHEAKRREAQALLYAENLGDTVNQARCKALVREVRDDASLAEGDREQVAAFSDNLDVNAQSGLTPDARLLAFEKVARSLHTEYPDLSAPAESLVAIAEASDDDHAASVAQDVVTMNVSPEVNGSAVILLRRLGLKGASLADIASATLGADNAVQQANGHPVVVYTWSAASTDIFAIVADIASKAPSDTEFIGVCMDMGDLTAAKSAAAGGKPTGTLVYDSMGYMGKFAGRLAMTHAGLIYAADRKGMLVSVSAQHDPAALLASLSKL